MLVGCKTRWLLHLSYVLLVTFLIFSRFSVHFNKVLRPFLKSVSATCTTSSWKYIKSPGPYPCPEVLVQVQSNSSTQNPVKLYEDEDSFYKSTCSFHPRCPKNNSEDVDNYIKQYGAKGTTFPCKHAEKDSSKIIRISTDNWTIFHYLFWPGLVIFLAFAAFLRIVIGSLCQECCATKVGDTSKYVPNIVDGKLRCPCQDGTCCNVSCECLELSSNDFCLYQNGSTFLGIVCKFCWRESLVTKLVNLNIQVHAPAVKVKKCELRYRPPSEAEFNTCFIGRSSLKLVDPEYIAVELNRGDHIMWHRPYGSWHHAVVGDIVAGLILVIEWSSVQGCHCVVHEHMVDIEACKFCYGDLYKVNYEKGVLQRNPTDLVLARARSMLGLTGYGFFSRDSESFAKFCKSGINFNHQYPCLLCRLTGYDYRALMGTVRGVIGFGTLKTVLLAGMLQFALNPLNVRIAMITIFILELISHFIDIIILHMDYGLSCLNCCGFCCCGIVPNDSKKTFWMRIAETVFGVLGMIGGVLFAHGVFWCPGSGLWYIFKVSVFGCIVGSILGTLGKYVGCMFAYLTVKKFCYRFESYEEL